MLLANNIPMLQSILNGMQDMLRVVDTSHKVIITNKSYDEAFGSQLGADCFAMFGNYECCRDCISKQAMETGKPQEKKRQFRGATYWVKSSPVYDETNNCVGAVEVFRDVTLQEESERFLREQNKRLLQESNVAARIQRELFVSRTEMPNNIGVFSRYLPANSLGGDLFGYYFRKDGNICFYVADVSGHGIASAMIAMVIANVLTTEDSGGPEYMLQKAQRAFLAMRADTLYVTMFVGILDTTTGLLRWSNAGHNAVPLLVCEGRIEELFLPALPLCSWEQNEHFPERVTRMERHSQLLIYTDGLLDERSSRITREELRTRSKRLYGEDLLESLERLVLPERGDDVCMLLLTRL
ncbi:MAG: SpoIIE family protein phosphatase [Eubacteriales bacterium]|nr:SpoIIE family protein phosphatase [Eubacteriales bacterium]